MGRRFFYEVNLFLFLQGLGIGYVQWFGMLAPAGTPAAIVNRLNEALRQAMQDPEVAKRLTEQGGFLRPGSPEDFATFIADEVKAWGDIVRAAKVEL